MRDDAVLKPEEAQDEFAPSFRKRSKKDAIDLVGVDKVGRAACKECKGKKPPPKKEVSPVNPMLIIEQNPDAPGTEQVKQAEPAKPRAKRRAPVDLTDPYQKTYSTAGAKRRRRGAPAEV